MTETSDDSPQAIYESRLGRRLTAYQLDVVNHRIKDLDAWREACDLWRLRGYAARILDGLFDVYERYAHERGRAGDTATGQADSSLAAPPQYAPGNGRGLRVTRN